jgi:hypothetical protein
MDPTLKHTAVLVVHGMGLQRPLDTVRGIIKAVWQTTHQEARTNKIWMHPERSSIDIDLPVITTSAIPNLKHTRNVDFHELYWAHLMSRTPALAVLQWLFELARKGPRLKPNMQLLWYAGTLFLVLMIFSTSLLALKLTERLGDVGSHHQMIVIAPTLMFLIFFVASACVFVSYRAWWFAARFCLSALAMVLIASAVLYFDFDLGAILPSFVAGVATWLLMGNWGIVVFAITYGLSIIFEILIQTSDELVHIVQGLYDSRTLTLGEFVEATSRKLELLFHGTNSLTDWLRWAAQFRPWAMDSSWCVIASCIILSTYVIISIIFLQPYLGDPARYFRNAPSNVAVRREIRRQAVNALEGLHTSGRYDRIVVVAHSLGSVIAYDMLRAYFARVASRLPTTGDGLDEDIKKAENKIIKFQNDWSNFKKERQKRPSPEELRRVGRQIIGKIAAIPSIEAEDKWLVTDFVTLGSPLTHAHYLMCQGETANELAQDFERLIEERAFPVCPPTKLDKDEPLTYTRDGDATGSRWFHNGALFGLTRWTNIYFVVSELFRGDAIGGPLEDIFGGGIIDIALPRHSPRDRGVDAHIRYWDVSGKNPLHTKHIIALRSAIDLADEGLADVRDNFAPAQTSQQQLKV